MSEYKRSVVDLLDFVRRLDGEVKDGRPQYKKAIRKAQIIALELSRPHDMQRCCEWIYEEPFYRCFICDYLSDRKYKYCPNCGARMTNQEKDYED